MSVLLPPTAGQASRQRSLVGLLPSVPWLTESMESLLRLSVTELSTAAGVRDRSAIITHVRHNNPLADFLSSFHSIGLIGLRQI